MFSALKTKLIISWLEAKASETENKVDDFLVRLAKMALNNEDFMTLVNGSVEEKAKELAGKMAAEIVAIKSAELEEQAKKELDAKVKEVEEKARTELSRVTSKAEEDILEATNRVKEVEDAAEEKAKEIDVKLKELDSLVEQKATSIAEKMTAEAVAAKMLEVSGVDKPEEKAAPAKKTTATKAKAEPKKPAAKRTRKTRTKKS